MPRPKGFKLSEEHKSNIGLANYKGGRKKHGCYDCGNLIKLESKRCNDCFRKYSVGKNHPRYNGKDKICVDCGIDIYRYSSRCRKCWGISNSLDNHPMWVGGESFKPYPPLFKNKIRYEIRERDNNTCRICGISKIKNGSNLDVHHINYNKDNMSQSNLISLCKICHMKTNRMRNYWEEFFLWKFPEITRN